MVDNIDARCNHEEKMHVCLLKKAHSDLKKNIYAMTQAQGLARIKSKHNSDRDREFPVCDEG